MRFFTKTLFTSVCCLWLWGQTAQIHAATINVPADQPTIQDAINAASAGDEIIVAPGTYNELVALNKTITLRSSDPTDPSVVAATIIDAGGAGRPMTMSGGGNNPILDGFVITGGDSANGGGLNFSSGPDSIVRNCVITGNTGNFGAGMRLSSSGRIENCTVSNNVATNGGGGFDTGGSTTVVNTTFIGNTSPGNGGGGICRNALTFKGCTFIGNSAISGGGGGVFASNNGSTWEDCAFICNTAAQGGGMQNLNASGMSLLRCSFINNTVTAGGGGGGLLLQADTTVADSVFSNNTSSGGAGGGIRFLGGTTTMSGTGFCNNVPDQTDGAFADGGSNSIGLCGPIDLTVAPACPADITNATDTGPDGDINVFDLLKLLANWGSCTP